MMVGDSKFEVSIVMSRKWDGSEVAEEISRKIMKNTSKPPKFILLFTTIHYKNEFKKLLTGIKKKFSISPLVGCTVAGFMNQDGCFTRGVTALAVDYSNMDIFIGVGHNTKKNPEEAASNCAKTIIDGLENSRYKENFILQLVSGATVPEFPGVGKSFVLKGKIKSSFAAKLIETSTKKMQKGIGREEEILEKISKLLKNSHIISASSCDDTSVSENYQFYDEKIFTNSIIAICLNTDKKIEINYNHGFHKFSDDKLKITSESFDNRIIKKINNNDAVSEFTRTVNWSETTFESIINRKTSFYNLPTVYFPLGFEYADGTLAPAAVGAILGKGFSFNYKIKSDDLFVLTATGKDIVNSFDKHINTDSGFIFGISCVGNLVTLGDNVYAIQERIKNNLNNFLILFTLGEGVYIPSEEVPKFFNEANIILSIK